MEMLPYEFLFRILLRYFVFIWFLGVQILIMLFSTYQEHKLVSATNACQDQLMRKNLVQIFHSYLEYTFALLLDVAHLRTLARAMWHEHLLDPIRLPFFSDRGVVEKRSAPSGYRMSRCSDQCLRSSTCWRRPVGTHGPARAVPLRGTPWRHSTHPMSCFIIQSN
jgi:hypothetical protein